MIVEQLWQWICIMTCEIEVWQTLVFICVFTLAWYIQSLRHLPPGPWGLPFLGSLFKLQQNLPLHLQYSNLAKKYGPIFSIKVGNQLIVVLSDYNLIYEAFRQEDFTNRPHTEFTNILGGCGIINTEGKMWKEQRNFLLPKFNSFGKKGGKNLEPKIVSELTIFLRKCANQNGKPINVSSSLGMSVSNVICSSIMGVRFFDGDERFKRFMNLIEEGFKLFANVVSVNYLPRMRHLPYVKNTRDQIERNRMEMGQFFQETIDKQKRTFDVENVERHLLDSYFLEIEEAKKRGQEAKLFQGKNHDRHMQQILGDLFSAGMETVKTTLEWAMLLMLHNPKAARAVQEELDRVVGSSRMPTMEDQKELPITNATIQEILRRSSIVPLGTTHATKGNVTLGGYTIPADSQVVPHLYAVHMDPNLWEDPESFKPSRFLITDKENKVTVSKPKYFMPFGVGRRSCLGIVLAQMEIFLYFSSLMHAFDLRLPENASLPSLRGNAGVTLSPDRFQIRLMVRKPNLIGNLNDNNEIDGPLRNVGGH